MDQKVAAEVKRDLNAWKLGRILMVLDTGFNSPENRGIIPPSLASSLADRASFGNVLVQGDLKVDPRLVHGHLGQLGQLREFATAVATALEQG